MCQQQPVRLPLGAVLALERLGVAELRVGTAAATTEPGGRRGGTGGAGAGVGAGRSRQLGSSASALSPCAAAQGGIAAVLSSPAAL